MLKGRCFLTALLALLLQAAVDRCAVQAQHSSGQAQHSSGQAQHSSGQEEPSGAAQDASINEPILFWPTPLDTIRVVAPRPSRSGALLRASSFATLIDVAQERGPAECAADLLERSVGISVRRYGGPGSLTTISIRGADPGEVEIFLDRVPLRTASLGLVDLSTIDLAQVESVEIYRSAPPTDLGGEVSGAAVRLVTRSGGPHHYGLRANTGSQDTRTLEAFASGSWTGSAYFLCASRFRTAGDFLYFNNNGTEHDTSDDAWQRWTNGDVLRESLFGRLSRGFGSVADIAWSSQFWRSDQGIPGTNHQPTLESRLCTRGCLHRAELTSQKPCGGPFGMNLFGFFGNEDRHYRDPVRELAVPGASATKADQEMDRRGVGLQMNCNVWPQSAPYLGVHKLEALLETRYEELRNLPLPNRPEENHRRRTSEVLSIGDCCELLDGYLRFDVFHRWDRSRNNYTGANPYRPFESLPMHTSNYRGPRLGVRATLGCGHIVKANYARQARFPTFSELFGYAGTIHSNPSLKPEEGWRADLGWIWHLKAQPLGMRIRTENVLYTSDLEQMIVLIRISNRTTKPFNLDKAHIHGYEFTMSLDHLPLLRSLAFLPPFESAVRNLLGLERGVVQETVTAQGDAGTAAADAGATPAAGTCDASISGHLEWQHTRDEGRSEIYHGQELTYHPPLRASLRLDLIQDRWLLRYDIRYRAASYWSRLNLPEYRSEAQWKHEAQVRWRAGRLLTLSLRIENIFDERQEDIRGYSLPGRSWFGGIELNLRGAGKQRNPQGEGN